jgi:mannonate dehydratase
MNGDPPRPWAPPPWHHERGSVRIRAVRAICTAPEGIPLVVVKVETTERELYGLGCATFTQRPRAVVSAIEDYLAPLLTGRDPADIEDIWQSAYVSSYWRGGPVLNYALAGVDIALWDILGKRAGMPVHGLLGGRCRMAVPVYGHASGRDAAEVEEDVRRYLERGYRHVRCQVTIPGASTYGAPGSEAGDGRWDPSAYCRAVPRLFEHLRQALGEEVELLHDVHERLPAVQALGLAKALEPYRLFFLEDPLPPEQLDHFRLLRGQVATPLAMGELLTRPSEYLPLIQSNLIDFVRMRVTAVGGLSVAKRIAALCEFFGIRTAWQCPLDVSPVGHAATLALDLAIHNFGIQETQPFAPATHDVFPGCPELRDGCLWPSERPGLGIDLDETAAARFPPPEPLANDAWTQIRLPDGSLGRP